MTTRHNPEECARLIAEARELLSRFVWQALPDSQSRRALAARDRLEAAQAEIDSLKTAMEVSQRAADRRGAERDKLRAELEAARPIVDAVIAWCDGNDPNNLGPIIDAYSAYRAARDKGDG